MAKRSTSPSKLAITKAQAPHEQLDLRPGQSIELLKALHILTREGKINQDSRRKLKQVYHLFQFIEPLLLQVKHGLKHAHLLHEGRLSNIILRRNIQRAGWKPVDQSASGSLQAACNALLIAQ